MGSAGVARHLAPLLRSVQFCANARRLKISSRTLSFAPNTVAAGAANRQHHLAVVQVAL